MFINNPMTPPQAAKSQAGSYQPFQPMPCQPCYQPCYPCQPQFSTPPVSSQSQAPLRASPPQPIPSTKKQEYVPYERVVTEMQTIQQVQRVPREQVTYQIKRQKKTRPVERWVTDYIQVEKLVDYKVEYIPEQKTEYVKMQVQKEQYEYVPVQKQRILYPQEAVYNLSKQILGVPGQLPSSSTVTVPPQTTPSGYLQSQPTFKAGTILNQPSYKQEDTYNYLNGVLNKPLQKSLLEYQDYQKQGTTTPLKQSVLSIYNSDGFDGILLIQNLNSGKAIEYEPAKDLVGTGIWQKRSTSDRRQMWRLRNSDNGYNLLNVQTGLVLDFNEFKQGENLKLNKSGPNRSQIFNIQLVKPQEKIGYIRCSQDSKLCLGVKGDSKAEQAVLQLQKKIPNQKSQLFKITRIS